MIKYIAITYEVTFFRHHQNGYAAIHEGLPFTIPEGEISMVLEHVDGTKREVNQLVAGTVYEIEPRPDEPEAQSFYDRVIRERTKAKALSALLRESAKKEISVTLGS